MGLESTNYLAMAAAANSEIQSLLNQLQSEGVDTTKANYYLNSIYDVGMNGVAATSDNPYVQSQSIQNMLTKLSELVAVIALGSGDNANKRVKDNDKEIEATQNDVQKMNQQLGQKLQSILDDCEGNAEKINKIIEEIEKLGGGNNGEVAIVQQELEEQLRIIEENKLILNNDDTDAAGRKAAISAILGAASAINGLTERIVNIKDKLEEKTQEVTGIVEENADLMATAESTITEGIQGIAKEAAEFTQEGAKTTQLGAEGTTREVTGTAQVSTASTMMNNAVSLEEGIRLQNEGNKNIQAGQTLMQGSASGITKIASGTGEVGDLFGHLNDYAEGIGQFSQGFADLIGAYSGIVSPLITAVGSYENIDTVNQGLQTYVSEYTSEVTGGEIKQDSDLEDFNEIDENSIQKKKFDFDTSIFRNSKA